MNPQQQQQQQQLQQQSHLRKLQSGRSQVADSSSDTQGSGSGDTETKEINDILDSMNKD